MNETLELIFSLTITGWLSTILIAILTWLTVKLSFQRRKLPPGPLPLPIVGNLLSFSGSKPALDGVSDFCKTYGDVITIWLGSKPHIVISNWNLIKEALLVQRDSFSGRPHSYGSAAMLNGGNDIIFDDFSPIQVVLRKIGAAAVRKYVATSTFVEVTYDNALEFVNILLKHQEPFNPADLLYDLLCNVMNTIAFGEGNKKDNKAKLFKSAIKCVEQKLGNGFPSDFIPVLRPFFRGRERDILEAFQTCYQIVDDQIQQHKKTFKDDDIRDFVDAVLKSKEEIDKKEQLLLTDDNLKQVIGNLFLASVGTTQQTMAWIFLYLGDQPKIQDRVYDEIKNNIGDRMPTEEAQDLCPYTRAVISEIMRVRTPVPFNLPRKTTCDSKIGGYNIPSGVTVLFNYEALHKEPTQWSEPDLFKPDRFLDQNGSGTSGRNTHYAPFSLGNRNCIGERLARMEIFIILVTVLQKCVIRLEKGPGSADLTSENVVMFSVTKPFKIICKPR